MNIIYFGTTKFSKEILKYLVESGFNISLVVTLPLRKKGRGQKEVMCPVYEYALNNNLKVLTDNPNEDIEYIKSFNPDIFITCAYGILLKEELLSLVDKPVNIHTSYLPALRGSAPIERSLIDGLSYTGVSIMKMIPKMDAGDVYLQKKVLIENDDFNSLESKLLTVSKKLITEYLNKPDIGGVVQDEELVTYANKIEKEDYYLKINSTASTNYNYYKALGYLTIFLNGNSYKVFNPTLIDFTGDIGRVYIKDNSLIIPFKDQALAFTEIQKAGKKRMLVRDFINGSDELKGVIDEK